jgi:hypothetical protein
MCLLPDRRIRGWKGARLKTSSLVAVALATSLGSCVAEIGRRESSRPPPQGITALPLTPTAAIGQPQTLSLGRFARITFQDGKPMWLEYDLIARTQATNDGGQVRTLVSFDEHIVNASPIADDQVTSAIEIAKSRSAAGIVAALGAAGLSVSPALGTGGAVSVAFDRPEKDVLDIIQQGMSIYQQGQDANLWKRPSKPVIH